MKCLKRFPFHQNSRGEQNCLMFINDELWNVGCCKFPTDAINPRPAGPTPS